jgi:hypothetical protein
MMIDNRLDRLTERHEALTQSGELLRAHGSELSERLARQAEKSDREHTALNRTLRRAIRMAVTETRNERRRRQTLDEYITKLAAAQLITEEKMQVLEDRLARFIDASRGGGTDTRDRDLGTPACYISRRPSIAFHIVTSSANSMSLPTGIPMAMRDTFTPSGFSSFER